MERELNEGNDRREEAEQYARILERELEDPQKDAEIRELRAAARETAKWEEREARLVQQVTELKRGGGMGCRVGCRKGGVAVGGTSQERRHWHYGGQHERASCSRGARILEVCWGNNACGGWTGNGRAHRRRCKLPK